ncbi:MAG: NADP oxidoreductase [Alphaproteobacteria bacterium]|nr:NADP oxidoreductase [Alphaproteobacteria bacterium]
MRFGVLGTGMVGMEIAGKLATVGQDVRMGARQANNAKASSWAIAAGGSASHGTFGDAAAFGDVVFNCIHGVYALEALRAIAGPLRGKILVDVSNPIDYSRSPPGLTVCDHDSLGEQIQRALPETRVVKALNIVGCKAMVDASYIPGEHDMFVSGNDGEAKAVVTRIVSEWFGWRRVIDLGDIASCRGTEAFTILFHALWKVYGTPYVNIQVAARPKG